MISPRISKPPRSSHIIWVVIQRFSVVSSQSSYPSSRIRTDTVLSICTQCQHLPLSHQPWASLDLPRSPTFTLPDRIHHIWVCSKNRTSTDMRDCTQVVCHLATSDREVDRCQLPSISRCSMAQCQPSTSSNHHHKSSTLNSLPSSIPSHNTQDSLWDPVFRLTLPQAMAWTCGRCPCRLPRPHPRNSPVQDSSQATHTNHKWHSRQRTSTISSSNHTCRLHP